MGILDTLFGLGSTNATNAAVAGSTDSINNNADYATRILRGTTDRANNALTTGTQGGLDALTSGFGQARNDLLNYGGQAAGALTNGVNTAVNTVQGSNANYSPYLSSGGGASTMLGNALGLNGASGSDAARAAFTASPGYGWQVDQASDAAARKAASLGMAGSGNTLAAITDRAANLANTEWANWLTGLSGLSGEGLNAANSVSSNNVTAGGFQANGGSALASLFQSIGSGTSGLDTGLATGTAGLKTNLGNALSGNLTSMGSNIAQTNMGAALSDANISMQGAQAQDNAANTNSGMLSKLFGSVLGLPLGGASLNPGGLQLTPSTGGGVTINSAPTSGSQGLLGGALSNLGKSLTNSIKF